MSPSPRATISAQPGPQTAFLRSEADICIYGGAAGGGKTVGLSRIGSGFFTPMRNRSLPGRHITDCQTRLYMSFRQAETPTVAAAKAGFSAATAYRIDRKSTRLNSSHGYI